MKKAQEQGGKSTDIVSCWVWVKNLKEMLAQGHGVSRAGLDVCVNAISYFTYAIVFFIHSIQGDYFNYATIGNL